MKQKFDKLSMAGDDYIIINCLKRGVNNIHQTAVRLCDRHSGVGANNTVFIFPSEKALIKIVCIDNFGIPVNSDSGAICCAGKWIYENKISESENFLLEYGNRIYSLKLKNLNGKNLTITCNLDNFNLTPDSVPVLFDGNEVIDRPFFINNEKYLITCISFSEPHCVFFTNKMSEDRFTEVCEILETNPLFPKKTNIEAVKIIDDKRIEIRTWKLGIGEIISYGNGACASAAAAVLSGKFCVNTDILVRQRGGNLIVNCNGKSLFLTAKAEFIFTGYMNV